MVKHTQTIRRFSLTNFLSVFDHFVGLVLKGLNYMKSFFFFLNPFYKNIPFHPKFSSFSSNYWEHGYELGCNVFTVRFELLLLFYGILHYKKILTDLHESSSKYKTQSNLYSCIFLPLFHKLASLFKIIFLFRDTVSLKLAVKKLQPLE